MSILGNRAGWRLCPIVLCASIAIAEDDEVTPGLDFLEYLGEWQSADGEWVNPLLLIEQNTVEQAEGSVGE